MRLLQTVRHTLTAVYPSPMLYPAVIQKYQIFPLGMGDYCRHGVAVDHYTVNRLICDVGAHIGIHHLIGCISVEIKFRGRNVVP